MTQTSRSYHSKNKRPTIFMSHRVSLGKFPVDVAATAVTGAPTHQHLQWEAVRDSRS